MTLFEVTLHTKQGLVVWLSDCLPTPIIERRSGRQSMAVGDVVVEQVERESLFKQDSSCWDDDTDVYDDSEDCHCFLCRLFVRLQSILSRRLS